MLLKSLKLQNFRNYQKNYFTFSPKTTVIVGPNTVGKTNILEAIFLLSHGTSFKAEKDSEMVFLEKDLAHIESEAIEENDLIKLEITLSKRNNQELANDLFTKRYFLNGVPKKRIDFVSILKTVLFVPSDLEIIIASPSVRRNFLDSVLELTDRQYRISLLTYNKALRQRNALLQRMLEHGEKNITLFEYWDQILIKHGTYLTNKREELISFINKTEHDIFQLHLSYEKSIISPERLDKYHSAELATGVTLVGPHRDDFKVFFADGRKEVKQYGSRGQQRLAVLQLKYLQLAYVYEKTEEMPILLLDDIFSELDSKNIKLVYSLFNQQQTILTTTHEEFIHKSFIEDSHLIRLGE